jgi:hypothetical protein
VEVEVAEAEEELAVEEEMDEAETAAAMAAVQAAVTPEAMPQPPRAAVAIADSPERVAVVMGPEPVVVLEAEVEARAGSSARFCGLREICPVTSNPYRLEPG